MNGDRRKIGRPWWAALVLVVTLAGLASGAIWAARVGPTSTAQARLLFSVIGGNSATDLNQAATYLERQMTSFVQIATSDRVLVPASRALGGGTTPAELSEAVTVTNPTNTVLLDVEARGADPQQVVAQADAVTAELGRAVTQLSPTTEAGANTVQAGVIQDARVTSSSAGVPVWQGAVAGGVVGLLLGSGLAWFLARPLYRDASVVRRR